jgi:hypothetical protein
MNPIPIAAAALFAGYHPPPAEYVFVKDVARHVGIRRGPHMLIGTLDANGNFLESLRVPAGASLSGVPPFTVINSSGPPTPVYEYRSGRLIKGELATDGSFVPEIGSAVIKFEDYRYRPDALLIWNLPGYFMDRDKLEERRKWLAEHLAEKPEYAKEKAKLDAAIGDKK